jgi:hypothetical protein
VVASASVLAVLMIVIGGFNYISSDAIDNKENGKHQIKNALGGMLLILVSWVILNTINPQLVSLKIASDPLDALSSEDFLTRFTGLSPDGAQSAGETIQKVNDSMQNLTKEASDQSDKIRSDASATENMLSSYEKLTRMKDLQGKTSLDNFETEELGKLKNEYGNIDLTKDPGLTNYNNVKEQVKTSLKITNGDTPEEILKAGHDKIDTAIDGANINHSITNFQANLTRLHMDAARTTNPDLKTAYAETIRKQYLAETSKLKNIEPYKIKKTENFTIYENEMKSRANSFITGLCAGISDPIKRQECDSKIIN